jgi:site-specific DNA-methyltransferase (adenine-specific)
MSSCEVLVGDCRKVMSNFVAGSIDTCVTDPPFNLGVRYHDKYNDKQRDEVFLKETLEPAVVQIRRVLKPTGSLFLFMGSGLQAEALVLLKKIGFHHRRTIAWYNTFGNCQQRNFTPSWTAIHYVTKHPANFTFNADAVRVSSARQLKYADRRANPKGKLPDDTWVLLREHAPKGCFDPDTNLWEESRVCGTFKERVDHVTQLPLPVVERIIRVASNPNDVILDPFAGSGTVIVAAQKLGRRGLGIELSEETAVLANERLSGASVCATAKPSSVNS